MNGFLVLFKTNLKLLLRNRGYLAFIIILPMLSIIMLNINNINISDADGNVYAIQEMKTENKMILNVTNSKINVKIYDCSNSELSEYIIQELANTGAYHIYRYKSEAIDIEEVREKALYSANRNVVAAIIYIPASFEAEILSGDDSNIVLFDATKDGRIELLETNLKAYLQTLYQYRAAVGNDKATLLDLLNTTIENAPLKEIVSIEVGDDLNLTADQMGMSSSIGYSIAFLTISSLFCGIFIASTVIEERNNRVFNRFLLSTSSLLSYGFVKVLMILMTALLQTGIIAIGILAFLKDDFGIPFISYLFLVFCLGLIFNLFSVVIGILTNNVLTANYIVFLVWCLSAILAGLYFPLDGASKWWVRVSLLMPQRWVVKSAEMIMAGKSGVYSMFILVVLSYVVVIVSVGFVGIKVRPKE